MKTITLLANVLILAIFSISAFAGSTHWDQVEMHTKEAITSSDGKSLAKHAEEAKKHAVAAKEDQQHKVNSKIMDKGIAYLNDAIKEGNSGNLEAAQKAAKDAIYNFERAAK